MVDGSGTRPSDIVSASNGKTVEVRPRVFSIPLPDLLPQALMRQRRRRTRSEPTQVLQMPLVAQDVASSHTKSKPTRNQVYLFCGQSLCLACLVQIIEGYFMTRADYLQIALFSCRLWTRMRRDGCAWRTRWCLPSSWAWRPSWTLPHVCFHWQSPVSVSVSFGFVTKSAHQWTCDWEHCARAAHGGRVCKTAQHGTATPATSLMHLHWRGDKLCLYVLKPYETLLLFHQSTHKFNLCRLRPLRGNDLAPLWCHPESICAGD